MKLNVMESIKYTSQGDMACSWCEYLIPVKRNVLQDWVSAEVSGMFCSESCASSATNNINYREKWGF